MGSPEKCPFCERECVGEKPMCAVHWKLTDATTRVTFIAAQQTYERNIYKGDSVDAFSVACEAAVTQVRERLENTETTE